MMPLEHTKKEVCDELVHSLQEWGVNRSDHYKFRQKAILDCMANLSAMPLDGQIDYQALKSQKFPTNYNDAYEHLLRNDDVPDIVNTYTDTLDGEGFLEPYFRNIDRRTGDIVGYRLKHAYQKLSSTQLDPLYRFSFHRTEREDLIFKRWFLEDDASTNGVLFEALLSCHMLQAEPCYNCKAQNTLRWNGGGNTSWQDIVCTNCKATFEVKTKATLEKLETALRFNNIQGGSFTAWCELKNSKQSGHKMYLVILPRQHTFNRKMQKVYPVTIAEIDNVLPKVYPGSFNTDHRSIRFKSSVKLKMSTKAKWFDLPFRGEMIDTNKIATKVYKERFSEETHDQMWGMFCGSASDSDSSDDSQKNDEVEEKQQGDDVEVITKELEKVGIPDDWEDLASDSD